MSAAPVRPTPDLARIDSLPGVTELVGVRTDGLLIVAADGAFRLVDREGGTYPFADAAVAHLSTNGGKAALVALTPLVEGDPLCPFRPDDLVAFSPGANVGALPLLDAQGIEREWTGIADGLAMAGTFDGTGRFGQSLLVEVARDDGVAVEEFDCRGERTTVATNIGAISPGIAVRGAGSQGGIDGAAVVLGRDGLLAVQPHGGVDQLPIEGWSDMAPGGGAGIAVVPDGFARGGGRVYLADTAGLLRVDAVSLTGTGVADGDLLVSAGAPARLIAVRCSARACRSWVAGVGPPGGRARGRPVVVADHAQARALLPRDGELLGWTSLSILSGVAACLVVPPLIAYRRRRRARMDEPKEWSFNHHIADARDRR